MHQKTTFLNEYSKQLTKKFQVSEDLLAFWGIVNHMPIISDDKEIYYQVIEWERDWNKMTGKEKKRGKNFCEEFYYWVS